MDILGWEDLGSIINWFYEQQKQGKTSFKVRDLRDKFNLNIPNANTRIKRFLKFGIIKPLTYGRYEIEPLSEERIQEIKDKIIPPNPIFKTYYFRGRQHTVEWIYKNQTPPMTLQYFAQRLQRGWSLKKALETPTRKYKKEVN
jgi:hypothetical protein